MKLLIAGIIAIAAGVIMGAKQSSDFVPTGSLLILSYNASGALTAAPIWNRGRGSLQSPIEVSLPGTVADAGVAPARNKPT